MNTHSPPTAQDHFDTCRQFQEFYQEALSSVGVRIPSPVLGQTTNEYRRKTLHALQQALLPQSHELARVDFNELKGDSLKILEPQCIEACKTERVNPRNVPPGQIKPIKVLDQYGRTQMTKFIGQESFVKGLSRAGRRVVSFFAEGRCYDAAKGSWK